MISSTILEFFAYSTNFRAIRTSIPDKPSFQTKTRCCLNAIILYFQQTLPRKSFDHFLTSIKYRINLISSHRYVLIYYLYIFLAYEVQRVV